MKKISKILSIVLVLAMVMSFALVAHAEDVTATLSFADKAFMTGYSVEQQVWEANGIKVTNDKGDSTSDVKDYYNPARFYANSMVTVEYPGMTKIVVTCGSENYAKVWAESNTDANATVTYEGSVATVVFATAADSFVLPVLTAQSRVSELTVYASAGEGGSDVPEETTDYYVAGQDTLCGSNWNPGDEANLMTKGADGLYTKVYENVAAGEYQLKVTIGDWTESWGGDGPEGNFLAVVEATSTVTVIFNPETKAISIECVPVPVLTVVDIATALAGADGEEFMVKGVVTCVEGQNVYVMDATGGICIRTSAYVEGLAVGETVIGTGSKSVYRGMTQLNGSYEKSEGGELVVNETTIDALTAADVCTYIKLSGVTVTEVFDNNGAYSSPNVTVTDGTNTIQIYKAVVEKNEDGTWAIKVDDKIDVYAAVGCYNETLQLRNTTADEITLVVDENPGEGEQPENPGEGEVNPGTGDMAIAGLALAMMAATAGVVVLKKKEF